MSEIILRDQFELEKQRDAEARLNRQAAVEQAVAVLRTRFDTFMEEYRDRAVSDEDLKALKRELEAEMTKQIGHICDHLDTQNAAQSKDILNRVEGMFASYQAESMKAQIAQGQELLRANADTRKELLRYGIGFALTVLSGMVLFWLTTRGA
jgi:flagellar motility protein MotE (MotC chaperone)